MPFGLDQLCDTQAQPRSRVLPLGTGSTRSEDPSSYRALRVRNSPFLTNVPLVSKATPQFAHKSIVHGDVLGSHVASAILCHVPSAEGRSKQSALPPHENSLINQVLPRISDTLHEMARNATPDFSQYSVLKGSEDVDDSPLASVDLDKYTKNPHSVPHSRVLRRACPLAVPYQARKVTGRALIAPVHTLRPQCTIPLVPSTGSSSQLTHS